MIPLPPDTFASTPLSKAYQHALIKKKLWQPGCPVSLDHLRAVHVSYYDFKGQVHHDGRLIVKDTVAKAVVSIFKRLYQLKFPIAKVKPISDYNGDDELSMNDNNTSSFNCRKITGQGANGRYSMHAYGLAIDLNPLQNPYVSGDIVLPVAARSLLKRQPQQTGMVEPIVHIFKQHGFTIWGGEWKNPIDYQHFQWAHA